mgnify:CR=1 FL=1
MFLMMIAKYYKKKTKNEIKKKIPSFFELFGLLIVHVDHSFSIVNFLLMFEYDDNNLNWNINNELFDIEIDFKFKLFKYKQSIEFNKIV